MASDSGEFHVPHLEVTDDLLERVQFSVSSRNAEAKICDTVAHIFGSPMVASPRSIDWSYITTGVVAMLRNKEVVKKKYVWGLNLCIYNIQYGVLVWKGRIPLDCNYTHVSDNFHVLALEEGSGILGIIFQNETNARSFGETVASWIDEGLRDDKGKSQHSQEPQKIKFRKEMISKPCNFQHVQGSQAIEECIEIERIKGHIHASLASFKLKEGVDGMGSSPGKSRTSSKSKRREPPKPKIPFKEIEAPATTVDRTDGIDEVTELNNGSSLVVPPPSEPVPSYAFQPTPPLSHHQHIEPPAHQQSHLLGTSNTGGSDPSQSSSSNLGRLSPLNLEDEINFAFTASLMKSSLDDEAVSFND